MKCSKSKETSSLIENEKAEHEPSQDEEKMKKEDKLPGAFPYIGLVFIALSSLTYSLMSVFIKLLSNFHPITLAVYRFAAMLLPSSIMVLISRQNIFPEGKLLILFWRSFIDLFCIILYFYAFHHLPLGIASVIIFSSPVFCYIFACLFLKESCGMFQTMVVVITVLGVVLISQPTLLFRAVNYNTQEVYGMVAACLGAILTSAIYILLRALKDVHYSVVIFNYSSVSLCFTVVASCGVGSFMIPQNQYEICAILGLGLSSIIGQFFLTKGIALLEAGPVSLMRTSEIVFAFIWQISIFHEVPTAISCIGAFLVISCILLAGFREMLLTLDENSTLRKMLWILEK